jgi:hypothetical protein
MPTVRRISSFCACKLSRFVFTDVSKVSSWRAVKKLIEKIPTALISLVPHYFAGQRAIFVTEKEAQSLFSKAVKLQKTLSFILRHVHFI